MTEYATQWVDDLPDLKRGEEIVRCRDCKRWESGDCDWNPYYDDPVDDQPDGFCSWACRKEQ